MSSVVLEFEHGQCTHKIALMADIQAAIHQIVTVHQDDFLVVISGGGNDSFDERIEAQLKQAHAEKKLAIERYRQHVKDHGC